MVKKQAKGHQKGAGKRAGAQPQPATGQWVFMESSGQLLVPMADPWGQWGPMAGQMGPMAGQWGPMAGPWGNPRMASASKGGNGGKGKVQKPFLKQAEAKEDPSGKNHPKGLLRDALPLLLGRTPNENGKKDAVYETSEENGKHVAVLTISDLPGGQTVFEGKPASTVKDAETNAAQKCVNVLAKEIKEAREARQAVLAEKKKAKGEVWKARIADKKAEAAAQKETAATE